MYRYRILNSTQKLISVSKTRAGFLAQPVRSPEYYTDHGCDTEIELFTSNEVITDGMNARRLLGYLLRYASKKKPIAPIG